MIAGNQQTAYLNNPDWPAAAIGDLLPARARARISMSSVDSSRSTFKPKV